MAVSVVDIQVNSQGAVRNLRKLDAASQSSERSVNGLTAGVNGLKAAIAPLLAAFSAIQTAKFVFAKTAELETQTRSIQVLTGSVAKAKQIISELQAIGAVTPFTSTELIDTAKRLSAFGVAANDVVDTTRRLGDVAGATGANLGELSLAYGQVIAKGRLQGEELLQFQERGVALQDELRKMYGLTGEEFSKALSKGQISAQAVEVALQRLTNTGGKYANGAIAQSDTLSGRLSTLQDGVEQLARTIGVVLAPELKKILTLAIQNLDAINAVLAAGRGGAITRNLAGARASMRIGATSESINRVERGIGQISGQRNKAGIQQNIQALREYQSVLQMIGPNDPNADRAIQLQGVIFKKINENIAAQKQFNATRANVVKPTGVPALLGETGGKSNGAKQQQLSVNDLLGGDIKRNLDKARAQLETSTAQRLAGVAGQSNAAQAKRMIEFSAKYRDTQLQINAIDQTLTARASIRSQLIASATDKAGMALTFDERSLNLKTQRNILEQDMLKTVAAQTALSKEQYAKEAIDNANALKSLKDEQELLQGKINGNEAEVRLNQQIRDLKAQYPDLNELEARGIVANIEALKLQLSAAEQMKQIYSDIGTSIKSGVVDAIQGAVDGTKSLGEVAANVLNNIANKILDVAINMALFGAMSGTGTGGGLLGGLFKPKPKALGGSVTAGQPYLVGERGPELFMPSRGGSIIPNNALGGGSTNVVVNVDAKGSSVQGDERQGAALGRAISAAVQAELVKQQRPGGLLAGTR